MWQEINPTIKKNGEKELISLSSTKIYFNRIFLKKNKLEEKSKVKIYTDEDGKKIGFLFLDKEKEDANQNSPQNKCFTLTDNRGSKNCSSKGVLIQSPWVKKYISLPREERKFKPIKEENDMFTIFLKKNEECLLQN